MICTGDSSELPPVVSISNPPIQLDPSLKYILELSGLSITNVSPNYDFPVVNVDATTPKILGK